MKKLVFLLLLLPCFGNAQPGPDTCFTQEELFDISETMDSLWTADSLNNDIISKQNNLIQKYQSIIQLDSLQLTYQKQQVELLQKNINLYVEREKLLTPKWYQNRIISFGAGMVTVLVTSKLINAVIK